MADGTNELVGRDAELATLAAAIGDDRSIAIVGEAGIGKTTLVRIAAGSSGRLLHEGGGFATLRDSPLLALRRAIGTSLEGDEASVAGRVERHVGPDLLFVDDLQWIDRATAAVLRLLAGRLGMIVGIRSGDPGSDSALALAHDLGLVDLRLDGLDTDAARLVAGRRNPGLGPTDVDRIVARAGGNPLLLEELSTRGEPSLVLTRSIRAGLAGLSPGGRDVLELLAVNDRPVDPTTLGGAVDEARVAGFLTEREGQVEIRHALIAETIRGELDDLRRRALHERAAQLASDPAEAARHLALAGFTDRAAATAGEALASTVDPLDRARLLVLIAEAADPAAGPGPRLAAAAALAAVSDWLAVVGILEPEVAGGDPEDAGLRDAFLAHALFSLGRLDEARAVLDRADRLDLEPGTPASGQLAIERAAFMVNVDGRIHAGIDYLLGVLAAHPVEQPTHHAIRSIVESLRMLAGQPVDIDYLRAAVDGAIAAGQFAAAADLARVVNFALLIWEGAEAALAFDDASPRLADAGARAAAECRVETVQAILAGRPRRRSSGPMCCSSSRRPSGPRKRRPCSAPGTRALGVLDAAIACLVELETSCHRDFVGRGILLGARPSSRCGAVRPRVRSHGSSGSRRRSTGRTPCPRSLGRGRTSMRAGRRHR